MDIDTAVCKSLRSIGISPAEEHQIEDVIVRQISSSGPEYVIKRMKELNDWMMHDMSGDTSYHPEWHAYRIDADGRHRPANQLESIIWNHSRKCAFSITGAIQKSIELVYPSEAQLTKWHSAIRSPNANLSGDRKMSFRITTKGLSRISNDAENLWRRRKWFSPEDITGSNIPGSGKYVKVKYDPKTRTADPASLIGAYSFSLDTAPTFVWQFLEDIAAPDLMKDNYPNPEVFQEDLYSVIDDRKHDSLNQDLAEGWFASEDGFMFDSGLHFDAHFGMLHPVGNIGFLQQEGGKLRTVANPNRLVQYCTVPFGEAIQHYFYNMTPLREDIFVKDQRAGMLAIQKKLREGVPMASFDMSSATDLLDYKSWFSDITDGVLSESGNDQDFLVRNFLFFLDVSSSPWVIPGHVADLIGSKTGMVSWKVGQPLGLRPSFPVLTAMNATMAFTAVSMVDGKYSPGHFMCCGDDLVIEDRYADAYMEVVRSYNGQINSQKSSRSHDICEFCSHIITKSSIFPKKPRWVLDVDASLGNIEKFASSEMNPRVPKFAKELYDESSRFFLPGSTWTQYSKSSNPHPLFARITANQMLTMNVSRSRDVDTVSLQTLVDKALDDGEITDTLLKTRVHDLLSSWATHAYESFQSDVVSGRKDPIIINQRCQSHEELVDAVASFQKISGLSSTSVELPYTRSWDYKKSSYVPKAGEISSARKHLKDLKSIGVDTSDSSIVQAHMSMPQGIICDVLFDYDPDSLEAVMTLTKDDYSFSVDVTDEFLSSLNELTRSNPDLANNVIKSIQIHRRSIQLHDYGSHGALDSRCSMQEASPEIQ